MTRASLVHGMYVSLNTIIQQLNDIDVSKERINFISNRCNHIPLGKTNYVI